jgi:hypothetical protein
VYAGVNDGKPSRDVLTVRTRFASSAALPASGVFGHNGVLTKEWTPLEPAVIDHKLYTRAVGNVLEQMERGGNERNELVALRR